jgi:hypothetical protein
MRKATLPLAFLALLAAIGLPRCFGSAETLFHQELVIASISATVSVINPGNGIRIEADFQSKTYPVGCLSPYRDLRYELRAADGRVIPVSKQALQHPPYDGPQTINHTIASSFTPHCEGTANGEWPTHALFDELYPNLSPGNYTLHISFAPHGTGQHADFAPVPISIKPLPQAT